MTASTTRGRVGRASAVVVALALVLAACGSSSKDSNSGSNGGSSGGSVTLNGSGSTFQKTFDEVAIDAFQKANSGITVNYAGGGSGKGKTDLQTNTVQWAGTDSTIKPEETSSYQGGTVLYFPTVAGPITVSYNAGIDKLQLSADTIAKIFSGSIKKWNDPAIAADNPGVTLPSTDIVITRRADASGTTKNFTKFLDAAAKSSWSLGSGDTVNWPADSQAGQGNAGVADIIKNTDGAIGYVDFSDATATGLKFAAVKNAAGKYVDATLAGASAAVAASKINADLTYDPINAPGADSYPITSPTWVIVYEKQTNKATGDALKSWLTYLLNDGQALAEPNNYAKLPASLQQQAVAQLGKLQIPA